MMKIRELREEAQLTQKQLAEKISNMQRNVSNWENGSSEPDLQTMIALADLFDVSLDELCGRERHTIQIENDDAKFLQTLRRLSTTQKEALYELLRAFTVRN